MLANESAPFRDRTHAGRLLAERLAHYANRQDVHVLAIPRGGVPVALEVAQALNAPLEVFVVRKLGVPYEPELAMGAIASGGVVVLSDELIQELGISSQAVDLVVAEERRELERRERVYRGPRPFPELRGRIAILVDDGIATGSSMRAAVAALRKLGAGRIVVAVPVAPPSACDRFRSQADEVVSLLEPEDFFAISQWYGEFAQLTDEQVQQLLARAPAGPAVLASRAAS